MLEKKNNTESNRTAFNTIARVVSVQKPHEGYVELELDAPAITSRARAGQFVLVRGWPYAEPMLPRPFDIMESDPQHGRLWLLIKITGQGTRLLSRLETGSEVVLTGPLGKGITELHCDAIGLLVRGAGAAAVVMLAQQAQANKVKVYTFHSASQGNRLVGRARLEAASDEYYVATDDGSSGYHGNATDLVDEVMQRQRLDRLYTCGSRRFARYVRLCEQQRHVAGYVFLEEYMACGLGYCHGCAVKRARGDGYVLVCTEGPVLSVSEVELA